MEEEAPKNWMEEAFPTHRSNFFYYILVTKKTNFDSYFSGFLSHYPKKKTSVVTGNKQILIIIIIKHSRFLLCFADHQTVCLVCGIFFLFNFFFVWWGQFALRLFVFSKSVQNNNTSDTRPKLHSIEESGDQG